MTLTEFLWPASLMTRQWRVKPASAPNMNTRTGATRTARMRLGGWSRSPEAPREAEHIARHDPARVLAECEVKREMVAMLGAGVRGYSLDTYLGSIHQGERVLRLLAQPYADHPAYRDEWQP